MFSIIFIIFGVRYELGECEKKLKLMYFLFNFLFNLIVWGFKFGIFIECSEFSISVSRVLRSESCIRRIVLLNNVIICCLGKFKVFILLLMVFSCRLRMSKIIVCVYESVMGMCFVKYARASGGIKLLIK